jgi:hypothetical protein
LPSKPSQAGEGIGEIQWDHFQINPAAVNRTEEIEKVLKEHELLITEWAPIHLAKMLQTWFWKDDATAIGALETWQKTCCYLYLPRLREADTLRMTIAAGASSRDFFGIAYGREDGRFQGFNFAQSTTPILDDALLLIEPKTASAFAERLSEEAAERAAAAAEVKGTSGSGSADGTKAEFTGRESTTSTGTGAPSGAGSGGTTSTGSGTSTGTGSSKKTMFFGSVELDPIRAKLQFSNVADEIILLFTQKPGVKVRIAIEIEAESPSGFDDGIQRAAKENCDQLKFKTRDFMD